ncbi:F0F1 ATP synthase subunit B [Alkalibacter rhizosphaerae]|uniref:ATP synthase subunit b n=1 Tax=Alkalibacter rhizosphaerae TaxID=2815577 RepID=A0A975AJ34_9FIRM|nr:F0F1 ATP synthase subunit B [Alkalibacter rhizosphaerae]QSX09309.1 F0F1 ATP synthase subunit B [Alkalibacter rhizosphaerae]
MGNVGMVNVDFLQIAANIVNFLILFFIIKHFFYNKIKTFMAERSAEVATEITEAEKQRQEAEAYRTEYLEKLQNIDSESRDIIRAATTKANEKRNEIVKQADQEADRIFERNQIEIQREKEKALEELKNDIVNLSVLAAEKVVETELDQEKHHRLILNFIEEAGEVQ